MNYRHAYHAGNFADVHKHVALTAILLHLGKKEKPFLVVDTHAGRGIYHLCGIEAQKTAEANEGIALLRRHAAQSSALSKYLEVVAGWKSGQYPGSPLITAALLRPQDYLIAIEKQPEEFTVLQKALAVFATAHAICDDGYLRLQALLPPPQRRGIVFIDPPYESIDELRQVARAVVQSLRAFATGIFLIWYPLKLAAPIASFCGELRNAGAAKLLSLTFDVGRRKDLSEGRLSAAGMLVINPPHGFDVEMRETSAELLQRLRRGTGAKSSVKWLWGR